MQKCATSGAYGTSDSFRANAAIGFWKNQRKNVVRNFMNITSNSNENYKRSCSLPFLSGVRSIFIKRMCHPQILF